MKRWVTLFVLPFAVGPFAWPMLRFRLIIEPDGVTVVKWRRRSFLWSDILRFDSKSGGEGGASVTLVPRIGRALTVPVPISLNGTAGEARRLAAHLNQALDLSFSLDENEWLFEV